MSKPDAAAHLLAASQTVEVVDDGTEAWDYGWCSEGYRRSSRARLSTPTGPARLTPEGVKHFEAAMHSLLTEQQIQKKWDPEELWGIVASLVIFLWLESASPTDAQKQVTRLRRARPSLVLLPAANVLWESKPAQIAGLVIGNWDDADFSTAIVEMAGAENSQMISEYIAGQKHRRPLVGFATTLPSQGGLAFSQAQMRLEQLCDATILLVRDKKGYGLHSVSGGWNRPGTRGLSLERKAIESAFQSTSDSIELATQPLVFDELGTSTTVHWHSADPVPLSTLLQDQVLRTALESVLADDGGIAARIRLAARWFAEAYWTTGSDDAALALGVALDALIGSKSGLPGRVMRERFALLEPEPSARGARANRYDEIFGVRSTVAHGGTSKRLSEEGFVRAIQADVTWAAWRLLAARDAFGVDLAADLDELFDRLRWGVARWPADSQLPQAAAAASLQQFSAQRCNATRFPPN